MFKPLYALMLVSFFCMLVHAQPPGQAGDLHERIDRLMAAQMGVENAIPAGWSIKAIPIAINGSNGDTSAAQFHIALEGPPAGTLFTEQIIPVGDDKPITELKGISVGKDGILECAGRLPTQCGDPSKSDNPIVFTAQTAKGEPVRFLFISSSGTIGIAVVPHPVTGHDRGCTLSAVRLTPGFQVGLITGTGFSPNINVKYTVLPGVGQKTRSDGRGVIRLVLMPMNTPGRTKSSLKLEVKAPSCSPDLTYDFSPK